MAVKNLYSLGLLRNGKVYANKQQAIQGLIQEGTNDGVAKLARYLEPAFGGDPIIRTLVGFYANAAEMENAGGGQSSYTILDIDGSAADVTELRQEVAKINAIIGDGIEGTTLTAAINDINSRLGEGFTSEHTVADALSELETSLQNKLKISLETAETPTSGYLKTYILSQGLGDDKEEIGKIDIPKDMVVSGGSLVHGTWDGDTFTEDPDGPDTAIKIEFANADTIYINTKDLVDFYTAGDGITVDNDHNVISIKYNAHSEDFLVVDENGIRVEGIQAAIDAKADAERLEGSDGISIASNKVKAVASKFSASGIKNPISVDKDGIKFANMLDCGFFDSELVIPQTASDVQAISEPNDVDLFLESEETLEALTKGNGKVFKSISISDASVDSTVELMASNSIIVDGLDVSGSKDGTVNGKINYSAPIVELSNINVKDGSTVYNVFEGDQTNANLVKFTASNVTVDDPSLAHNVFNIYKPTNDAVITIKDSKFNLTVDNSNIARIANYANSTGVTVNFENIEWTYENSLSTSSWYWAGLLLYQPASSDEGLSGDLTAMSTWTFNFKNCKYNGVKVTSNNFEQHNQVFIMYNVGGNNTITNPVGTLNINFE